MASRRQLAGGLLQCGDRPHRVELGQRFPVGQLPIGPKGRAIANLHETGGNRTDFHRQFEMDPRNRSLAELIVAALSGNLMTEQLALLLDACGNEASGFHGPHGTIQQRLRFRRGRLGRIGNPAGRRVVGNCDRGWMAIEPHLPASNPALICWAGGIGAAAGGLEAAKRRISRAFNGLRAAGGNCLHRGLLGGRHGRRTGGRTPSLRLQRPQPRHCRNGHENQGKQNGQFIPHNANLQDMPDFPKIRVVTGRPIDLR